MTFLGGSSLADGIWGAIKKYIPKSKRKIVAEELIDIFENHNCSLDDTIIYETAFQNKDEEIQSQWDESESAVFDIDYQHEDEDDED